MKTYLLQALEIAVGLILVQTLYFKFTAHPDSVYIFSSVGLEPHGRIGIGVFEFISALLLIKKNTVWLGAGLSAGIISGALFMHLTKLGIEVQSDGGLLFVMALIVFVGSLILLWNYRADIPFASKIPFLKGG